MIDGIEKKGQQGGPTNDSERAGQHRDAAGNPAIALWDGSDHDVHIGHLEQADAKPLRDQSGQQSRRAAHRVNVPAADRDQADPANAAPASAIRFAGMRSSSRPASGEAAIIPANETASTTPAQGRGNGVKRTR